MGWTQQIDYVDVSDTVLPSRPVQKQIWDGDQFVSMTLHKHQGTPSTEQMDWLIDTYGQRGTYQQGRFWDYSRAGNFTIMDEKIYMWYQMKWKKK